jgi:hypothetical protein
LDSHLLLTVVLAGATKLMTRELIATLCDHAQGNLRALMRRVNHSGGWAG